MLSSVSRALTLARLPLRSFSSSPALRALPAAASTSVTKVQSRHAKVRAVGAVAARSMPQADNVEYVVDKYEPSIENLVIPLGFVSEYLRIQSDFLRNLRLEHCGDEVELYWPYSPALSQ